MHMVKRLCLLPDKILSGTNLLPKPLVGQSVADVLVLAEKLPDPIERSGDCSAGFQHDNSGYVDWVFMFSNVKKGMLGFVLIALKRETARLQLEKHD